MGGETEYYRVTIACRHCSRPRHGSHTWKPVHVKVPAHLLPHEVPCPKCGRFTLNVGIRR